MARLGTENAFKVGADIKRCQDRGIDVIRLNLGEPDFDTAPHLVDAAIRQLEAGDTHYCDPGGIPQLREAIARHVSASRGLEVTPERVVVTPGAKPTIGYAMQTYVDPGDEVIYPSPGFPIYESWIQFVGATPVPLPLLEERGFAFSPEDLSDRLTDRTKLIILCSPSNPTGGVVSRQDLEAVAGLIRTRGRPDLRIYADEIYEHILFDGEDHHSIASCEDMAGRTVIASGHSKSFAMTGWRLGFAVLPTVEEADVFKQLNINTVSCVPPFIQFAGCEAFSNPKSATATQKMVAEFQNRRDWIVPALNRIDGIQCQMPRGAFYVFPNVGGVCEQIGVLASYESLPDEVREKTTPSGMLQMFLLYRHGVATMDRNSFGSIGAEGQHYLRLSIASSLEQLQEGVSRIQKAAGDRDGFASFVPEHYPS